MDPGEESPCKSASDRVWALFHECTGLRPQDAQAVLPNYSRKLQRYEAKIRRRFPLDPDSSDDEVHRAPWREASATAAETRSELSLFESRLRAMLRAPAAAGSGRGPPAPAEREIRSEAPVDARETEQVDDASDEDDVAERLVGWTDELHALVRAAASAQRGTTVMEAAAPAVTMLRLDATRVGNMDPGLRSFCRLRRLSLDNNAVETIDFSVLPETIEHLSAFACEASRLELGDRRSPLPLLSAVHVGCNRLKALPRALHDVCPALRSLDASWNDIEGFCGALPACQRLTGLEHLALVGNPLFLRPGYRGLVSRSLKWLRVLDDGRTVTPPEGPAPKGTLGHLFGDPPTDPAAERTAGAVAASDARGAFVVRLTFGRFDNLPTGLVCAGDGDGSAPPKPRKGRRANGGTANEADAALRERFASASASAPCLRVRGRVPGSALGRGSDEDFVATGPPWGKAVNLGAAAAEGRPGDGPFCVDVELPTSVPVRDQLALRGIEIELYWVLPGAYARRGSHSTGSIEGQHPEERGGDEQAPEEERLVARALVATEALLAAAAHPADRIAGDGVLSTASVHERAALDVDASFVLWQGARIATGASTPRQEAPKARSGLGEAAAPARHNEGDAAAPPGAAVPREAVPAGATAMLPGPTMSLVLTLNPGIAEEKAAVAARKMRMDAV